MISKRLPLFPVSQLMAYSKWPCFSPQLEDPQGTPAPPLPAPYSSLPGVRDVSMSCICSNAFMALIAATNARISIPHIRPVQLTLYDALKKKRLRAGGEGLLPPPLRDEADHIFISNSVSGYYLSLTFCASCPWPSAPPEPAASCPQPSGPSRCVGVLQSRAGAAE